MTGADEDATSNPPCPGCGHELSGDDLSALRCPGCGADLPPRLGI